MIERSPRCPRCGSTMEWHEKFLIEDGSPFTSYLCKACFALTALPNTPKSVPEPPAPVMAPREEREENLHKAWQNKATELQEMREEWDFGLSEIMHPHLRRKINRYFEPRVVELEKVVAELEARWATVRDELCESPVEAAKRDGYIAWLDNWLDEQEKEKEGQA